VPVVDEEPKPVAAPLVKPIVPDTSSLAAAGGD
jgi:hypothetical protein